MHLFHSFFFILTINQHTKLLHCCRNRSWNESVKWFHKHMKAKLATHTIRFLPLVHLTRPTINVQAFLLHIPACFGQTHTPTHLPLLFWSLLCLNLFSISLFFRTPLFPLFRMKTNSVIKIAIISSLLLLPPLFLLVLPFSLLSLVTSGCFQFSFLCK